MQHQSALCLALDWYVHTGKLSSLSCGALGVVVEGLCWGFSPVTSTDVSRVIPLFFSPSRSDPSFNTSFIGLDSPYLSHV